jgi:hypothetical protein
MIRNIRQLTLSVLAIVFTLFYIILKVAKSLVVSCDVETKDIVEYR